eukprot:3487462-Pyramimonas_sp.AAC.1
MAQRAPSSRAQLCKARFFIPRGVGLPSVANLALASCARALSCGEAEVAGPCLNDLAHLRGSTAV